MLGYLVLLVGCGSGSVGGDVDSGSPMPDANMTSDSGSDAGDDANVPDSTVGDDAGPMTGGVFVVVGEAGRRAVSADGIDWSNDIDDDQPDGDNNWQFRGVTFGNGMFVAVGGGTDGGDGFNGRVAWTTDGVSWNQQTDEDGWLGDVAWGDGRFVAAGGAGRVSISTNGTSWSAGTKDFARDFRGIAFGNGRFVAVGDGGRRAVSTDGGNSWASDIDGGEDLTRVAFGNGVFVAVGKNGRRITSADGATWTDNTTGGPPLQSIIFASERFIASGAGTVMTSPDGASWSTTDTGANVDHIAYGNNLYVATAWKDRLLSSSDALSWTERDNDDAIGFKGIAFGVLP